MYVGHLNMFVIDRTKLICLASGLLALWVVGVIIMISTHKDRDDKKNLR